MNRLLWTKEKPTRDGWYWVKGCPHYWSDEHGKLMPHGKYRSTIIKMDGGQIVGAWPWSTDGTDCFAGPIPEPLTEDESGIEGQSLFNECNRLQRENLSLREAGLDLLLHISPTVLAHKQEAQRNEGVRGLPQGPCGCVVCTRFRVHAEVLKPTSDLAELAHP